MGVRIPSGPLKEKTPCLKQRKKLENNFEMLFLQETTINVQYVELMERWMLTTSQIGMTCPMAAMLSKTVFLYVRNVMISQKTSIVASPVKRVSIQTSCTPKSDQIELKQTPPLHCFQGPREECARCGFTRRQLMKLIDMSPVTEKFMTGDREIDKNTLIEINKQKPCLTDDELAVKDIIL